MNKLTVEQKRELVRQKRMAAAQAPIQTQQATPTQASDEPSSMDKAIDYAGRVLGYPGGIARTVVAGAVDPFVDADLIQSGDIGRTIRGKAPTSEEILSRGNVPLSGGQKFWTGLALDTVADVGASAGIGALGKAAFKGLYKLPFSKMDLVSRALGKKPISDIAFEQGIRGGKEAIATQVNQTVRKLTDARNALLDAADKRGAFINYRAATQDAQALARQMHVDPDPAIRKAAKELQDMVSEYATMPQTGVLKGSSVKTNLTEQIKNEAFDPTKRSGPKEKLQKTLSGGIRKAVEQGVDSVGGDVARLKSLNTDIGGLLVGKEMLEQAALQSAGRSIPGSAVNAVTRAAIGAPTPGILGQMASATSGFLQPLTSPLGYYGMKASPLLGLPAATASGTSGAILKSIESEQGPYNAWFNDFSK